MQPSPDPPQLVTREFNKNPSAFSGTQKTRPGAITLKKSAGAMRHRQIWSTVPRNPVKPVGQCHGIYPFFNPTCDMRLGTKLMSDVKE